jgi:hypothetical protein
MAAPQRIAKMPFILVPDDGYQDNRHTVRAAQQICRIGHQLGYTPLSPLLHYLTYLSPGEISMEYEDLAWRWLKRCDRIWLKFPDSDNGKERLDSFTYDVLDQNSRNKWRDTNNAGRRPVYQLHRTCDDKIGFVPLPMSRAEVREMLQCNITAGLAARCL